MIKQKTVSAIQNLFLVAGSFGLTFFLLFTALEVYPGLPQKLNLIHIGYYAIKERYVADPELVLRIRPNFTYKGLFAGDISSFFSRSSFKPVPYEAVYDADGFRNAHGSEKTDAVILGDSYMEIGLNEGDTFAAHFEKVSGLKTANYGMGWYGPFQYLEVLKRYGLKNKPATALFCFFEGNDLKDTSKYADWKKTGSYYHFNASAGFISRFFSAAKDSLSYFGKLFIRRWDPRRAVIRLGEREYHTVFVYPVDARTPRQIKDSPEFTLLAGVLKEFKTLCDAGGIRPVFLFIPSTAHIYLPYSSMPDFSETQLAKQKAMRSSLEVAIKTLAAETGVDWISLTETFQTAAAEGKFLYYETDTHWNSEGRSLAAKFTAERLSSQSPDPDPDTEVL